MTTAAPWTALTGLLLAACGAAPRTQQQPVPLPEIRHGHCVVSLPDGLLCVGGYPRGGGGDECSARQSLWLADGAAQWLPRAPMRHGRTFFATAVLGDAAYAIGDGIERYDFAVDRWSEVVAPGALPRTHFAACAHQGCLYVLGGFPVERAGMRRVDVGSGEPAAARVVDVPPPPGFGPGDHFHLLVSLGDDLHCIGGLDGESFQPKAEHHVLRDGAWRTLPPPPVGIWTKFAAHAVHGGKLYVFGEFGGWCLDPASGTWSERRPLPEMVAMPATVSRGEQLWVIGGMAVEKPRNLLLRYAIGDDAWLDVEPPGQDR